MTGGYLDSATKEKYQEDFEREVLTTTGPLKVSQLLKPFLIRINGNPKLMTTWSGGLEEPKFKDSYVFIAYFQEFEKYLTEKLEADIEKEFKDRFQFYPGEDVITWNYPPEEIFESVYLNSENQLAATNKHYRNVWRFRIEYKSPIDEKHLQFWELLTSKLEQLQ